MSMIFTVVATSMKMEMFIRYIVLKHLLIEFHSYVLHNPLLTTLNDTYNCNLSCSPWQYLCQIQTQGFPVTKQCIDLNVQKHDFP